MPRELKKPDGTTADVSFFDEEDDGVDEKKKKKSRKEAKSKQSRTIAGIAAFLIVIIGVAGGVSAVNNKTTVQNPTSASSTTEGGNAATTDVSVTKSGNAKEDIASVTNGVRNSIEQLNKMIALTSDWDSIGEASLSVDRVDNDEENKAARYYYYDPYDEDSYGYKIKYVANPDGNKTSFGWRTSSEYCYLYEVLNYKGNKYLGLTGTNTAIRRTIGTRIKQLDWITIDGYSELKFNNKTAGVIESDTNIPVIQASAVQQLNSDGTSNFFLDDSDDAESKNGEIEESNDEVEMITDDNSITIDSVINSVQAIVSERDNKDKDDNYVDLETDESKIVSLDDLTVGDIYSLIPAYDTSNIDITYNLELADEMSNILSVVNDYILTTLQDGNPNISASSTEVSYKMDETALTEFVTGLQAAIEPLGIQNKILDQVLTDAKFEKSSDMATYTCSLKTEGTADVITHLLKVPTEAGVIKLEYSVKLSDKESITLEIPEKALKFEKLTDDVWSMYRDYIEIMSSVAYCESEYNLICDIIKENYNMSVADLVAKIEILNS
jgi:hypothetical protein